MESGKSGISLDTGLRTSPDSGDLRIALSKAASKALSDCGDAFLIIGRGTHEHAPGRMVIHVVAVPKEQADAACRVAMGEARAIAVKKPAVPTIES